jgi:hypothetical protein
VHKLTPILLGFCIIVLAIIFISGKSKNLTTQVVLTKAESSPVIFNLKSLPEHGVNLMSPSDLVVTKGKAPNLYPYSVLLRNNNSRPIVGYSINWQCFDGKGEFARIDRSHDKQFSNSFGYAFMYGEESERRAILNKADEVIQPNSTWLISPDLPVRKISGSIGEATTENEQGAAREAQAACPTMTVILDGVFFDDGTFIGPDTNGFFSKIKTQMEMRYEVLQGVQRELRSGKNPTEVFRALEQIRNREAQQSGPEITIDELRTRYRRMFAQDVLGMKEMWGVEGAIENIQRQLSRPWVSLRKDPTEVASLLYVV